MNNITLYTIFNKTTNSFFQLNYSPINNCEYIEVIFELEDYIPENGSPIWMSSKENVEKVINGLISESESNERTPLFQPVRSCEYEIKEIIISF